MSMDGFSVLVVDDEVDFVSTLLKRLNRKGVDCEGVYSGQEAIDRVRERGFDVVLLDMKLADIDGSEVLREMRMIDPEARVVVLSGHASASRGREALESGACDYLIKPVEFDTLFEKLAGACDKKA